MGYGKIHMEVWIPIAKASRINVSANFSTIMNTLTDIKLVSVRSLVNQIYVLYDANPPKWDNISTLSGDLGWSEITNSTTLQHYLTQGVSDKYIREMVEAATRVNYGQVTHHIFSDFNTKFAHRPGQNVDVIHALEGTCSMAATGASGIAGGNFQIFEQFLNRSGANVYLNTPVRSHSKLHIKMH